METEPALIRTIYCRELKFLGHIIKKGEYKLTGIDFKGKKQEDKD